MQSVGKGRVDKKTFSHTWRFLRGNKLYSRARGFCCVTSAEETDKDRVYLGRGESVVGILTCTFGAIAIPLLLVACCSTRIRLSAGDLAAARGRRRRRELWLGISLGGGVLKKIQFSRFNYCGTKCTLYVFEKCRHSFASVMHSLLRNAIRRHSYALTLACPFFLVLWVGGVSPCRTPEDSATLFSRWCAILTSGRVGGD